MKKHYIFLEEGETIKEGDEVYCLMDEEWIKDYYMDYIGSAYEDGLGSIRREVEQ